MKIYIEILINFGRTITLDVESIDTIEVVKANIEKCIFVFRYSYYDRQPEYQEIFRIFLYLFFYSDFMVYNEIAKCIRRI